MGLARGHLDRVLATLARTVDYGYFWMERNESIYSLAS